MLKLLVMLLIADRFRFSKYHFKDYVKKNENSLKLIRKYDNVLRSKKYGAKNSKINNNNRKQAQVQLRFHNPYVG